MMTTAQDVTSGDYIEVAIDGRTRCMTVERAGYVAQGVIAVTDIDGDVLILSAHYPVERAIRQEVAR